MELGNKPGCYLWNHSLRVNDTATWSGMCFRQLAMGGGEINRVWGNDQEKSRIETGPLLRGKKYKKWVYRYADGTVVESHYHRASEIVRRVWRFPTGSVAEGPYENGELHGQWVFLYANGSIEEGSYVEGKTHGQWVLRYADGTVEERSYVHGDSHPRNRWVKHWAVGAVEQPVLSLPEESVQALRLPPGINAIDVGYTCATKSAGSKCWLELDNQPGCYFWNPFPGMNMNMTATWNGACAGGLAEGTGEITWVWRIIDKLNYAKSTGMFQHGKMHGRWVERYTNGDVAEGPYVDGRRHGKWVIREPNGDVLEGPYVNGKRHSQWVLSYIIRTVAEDGSFAPTSTKCVKNQNLRYAHPLYGDTYYDARRGQWDEHFADGTVAEGSYNNYGQREGRWITRFASGTVVEASYVDNQLHGRWNGRFQSGDVVEGRFVHGKKHGRWVIHETDGTVEKGRYVNGNRDGRWVHRKPDGRVVKKTYKAGELL